MKWFTFAFALFNFYLIIQCSPVEDQHRIILHSLPSLRRMHEMDEIPDVDEISLIGSLSNAVPCSASKGEKDKVEKEIGFGVYGSKGEGPYEITLNDVKTKNENYKKFKTFLTPNITVVSGGMRTLAQPFTEDLKYRTRPGAIIYVKWDTRSAGFNYPRMAHEAPMVGNWAGLLMLNLAKDKAIDVSNMIGMGHSLGAHVIGNMGHYLTMNKLKMDHIIAMDPAKPCFEDWDELRPVQKSDAQFLQVIHSNTGTYGYKEKIGHIDIYPNNGDDQTGCSGVLKSICSHSYAVKLYLQENMKAYRAIDWEEFNTYKYWGKDNDNNTIDIGQDLDWRKLTKHQLSKDHAYYLHAPEIIWGSNDIIMNKDSTPEPSTPEATSPKASSPKVSSPIFSKPKAPKSMSFS